MSTAFLGRELDPTSNVDAVDEIHLVDDDDYDECVEGEENEAASTADEEEKEELGLCQFLRYAVAKGCPSHVTTLLCCGSDWKSHQMSSVKEVAQFSKLKVLDISSEYITADCYTLCVCVSCFTN